MSPNAASEAVSIPQLYAKHAREVSALIRAALRANEGRLLPAAKDLGVAYSTLHRLVHVVYPELASDAKAKPGRPAMSDYRASTG